MSAQRHRSLRMAVGALILAAGAASFAPPANAHPLGNLSVNHFHGLVVRADRLIDDAVVDTAELPTVQAASTVDHDGDGTASPAETASYGANQCALLASAMTFTVDGQPETLTVVTSSFAYRPGQAGLSTSRLECRIEAPLDVTAPHTLALADAYLADRVGWHEITASSEGVTLVDSPLPSESITGRLDHYPLDLLSSPLSMRRATLQVIPGTPAAATPTRTAPAAKPGRGLSLEALGPFAGTVEHVNRAFNNLIGRRQLTVGIGLLAIALALLLGASHAVLPGHGKTVMAAYIAGRQGSVRDAVLVGATVTATHTGGVLLLGLALTVSTALAGEVVLGWLGVASGLLIAGLGASLLLAARRRRELTWGRHTHGPHSHTHDTQSHHEDHEHDAHANSHVHDDHHPEPGTLRTAPPIEAHRVARAAPVSRQGLVGMGVAGGLVPSPSALIVLLSTIALGRTTFGIVLVVAYGLGMATTLTLAGILLVRVRDRYQTRTHTQPGRAGAFARRWARLAPFVTATLVTVVGLGLALRSISLI